MTNPFQQFAEQAAGSLRIYLVPRPNDIGEALHHIITLPIGIARAIDEWLGKSYRGDPVPLCLNPECKIEFNKEVGPEKLVILTPDNDAPSGTAMISGICRSCVEAHPDQAVEWLKQVWPNIQILTDPPGHA